MTVAQGGTGLATVATGSVLGYNSADTASAISSTSGTKVLTNTSGTISWETDSGMVYPGTGIALSTGSAWGTSVTDNSANWNTAYGWGNPSGVYLPLAGGTMTGDILMTSNKLIGGSTTTSDLTLQTTSGVGATGADMHFLVGNNGATEAMTILNNGNVGIGTTAPEKQLEIKGALPFMEFNYTGTTRSEEHTSELQSH